KIKDTLKKEKKSIAEEGKYTLQRKLDGMHAAMNQSNLDELAQFYKLPSGLDLLYEIATKKIDLKELKDFTVQGDKLVPPKLEVKQQEVKAPGSGMHTPKQNKKEAELEIFGESSDKILY